MKDPKTILVVEDEEPIAEAVAINLRREGYRVITAGNGEDGLRIAKERKTDLIVLDLMLPVKSGYDVCRLLREETDVPIIMLTARGAESDRVRGLEMGADDYIVKPFSMRELVARVRAVMRRKRQPAVTPTVYRHGDLELDTGRHVVTLDGKPLAMAPKEFGVLSILMSHPGQVFSRARILDRVWGTDAYVEEHTVDVHVRWLRLKIEKDPNNPTRLLTVRGLGYKLAESV